jgi:Kelch motif
MSWQAVRCYMQAPEMSTVRGSLAAAVLDDKVYAIGGGRPGISLETTEIYDPTLDTFMAGKCPLRCSLQPASQQWALDICV